MNIRASALLLAAALLPLAPQAQARQDKPITNREPSAVDIAKTPMSDLNLDKDKIPQVLIAARENPYDLTGLNSCKQVGDAVYELFTVLGPDLDIPQEERDRISAGRVAKWVVTSFIPFRGLIREISGAADHERDVRAAIQAGMTRRGFLKGVGLNRGCAYPAAPATEADIAKIHAELDRLEAQRENGDDQETDDTNVPMDEPARDDQERTSEGVPIVNEPVVQPTG